MSVSIHTYIRIIYICLYIVFSGHHAHRIHHDTHLDKEMVVVVRVGLSNVDDCVQGYHAVYVYACVVWSCACMLYVNVRMYVCMYVVCMCVGFVIYTHICMYIYACTYTHT